MNTPTFAPQDYLDLEHTSHRMLFENTANVWNVLGKIANYLQFSLRAGFAGELVGKPFIGRTCSSAKGRSSNTVR